MWANFETVHWQTRKKYFDKHNAVGDGRRLIVLPGGEFDQTTLSDVQLVPPPGELDEIHASSSILAYSLHYVKHDVIHKTENT